jgi:cbb3-type cytochrome oxidase maturation protein
VETIFVLLPLALSIAAIAVGFFIWAARSGQFDDLETPAVRILFDDEEPRQRAPADAPSAHDRSDRLAPVTPVTPDAPTPFPPSQKAADPTRRAPA